MCLGVPGQIIAIDDPAKRIATVDVAGIRRKVDLSCIVDEDNPPESCLHAWVLVHVGFAMSRIDEAEAEATLKVLHEIGELAVEREAMLTSEVQ
ncbi:MAG: HypC/HybG/HupF family hydrogenase formation chaperone [Proteobacteria bacterium]|nr:HypC/HybG/HupF family hydrogenase formation chaperone [Pseudomonadota bacterium]